MQTLLKAIYDPQLFAPFFRDAKTWAAWRTVLRALFGLRMAPSETELFQRCTGQSKAFTQPVKEAWLICGRRSGKSFIAALIAVFLACFRDYSPYLSPGERGVVMVLAPNRLQSRVIFRYIEALLDGIALLQKMVASRTAEAIELTNRIVIEVHTASYRSVRGYTVVAAICDEIAFWRDEISANPDKEILEALRPAMGTIQSPLLLCLSSPYARRGALFEAFQRHHGNDESDVLVWRAPTEVMNPTIDLGMVAQAFESDPQAASAEWGAEFRGDLSAFLEENWITAAIDHEIFERPPVPTYAYQAFADPSGGKKDSFTVAVSHKEGPTHILDLCREFRAPLNPDSVVHEIAGLLQPYRIRSVTGDRYAGEWVTQSFKTQGLRYELSEPTRSEIYLDTGPLLAKQSVRLLDQPRLILQLRQLERRTTIAGRDSVNHPPGGADDVANAALGAIWLAANRRVAVKYQGPPRFADSDYDELNHGDFSEREPADTSRRVSIGRNS